MISESKLDTVQGNLDFVRSRIDNQVVISTPFMERDDNIGFHTVSSQVSLQIVIGSAAETINLDPVDNIQIANVPGEGQNWFSRYQYNYQVAGDFSGQLQDIYCRVRHRATATSSWVTKGDLGFWRLVHFPDDFGAPVMSVEYDINALWRSQIGGVGAFTNWSWVRVSNFTLWLSRENPGFVPLEEA